MHNSCIAPHDIGASSCHKTERGERNGQRCCLRCLSFPLSRFGNRKPVKRITGSEPNAMVACSRAQSMLLLKRVLMLRWVTTPMQAPQGNRDDTNLSYTSIFRCFRRIAEETTNVFQLTWVALQSVASRASHVAKSQSRLSKRHELCHYLCFSHIDSSILQKFMAL